MASKTIVVLISISIASSMRNDAFVLYSKVKIIEPENESISIARK